MWQVTYDFLVVFLLLGAPKKTLCCNNHLHNSKREGFFLVLLFGPHIWTDCNRQSYSKNSPKEKMKFSVFFPISWTQPKHNITWIGFEALHYLNSAIKHSSESSCWVRQLHNTLFRCNPFQCLDKWCDYNIHILWLWEYSQLKKLQFKK